MFASIIALGPGCAHATRETHEFPTIEVAPARLVEVNTSSTTWSGLQSPGPLSHGFVASVPFHVIGRTADVLTVGIGDPNASPCPGQPPRGAEIFENVIARVPRAQVAISLDDYEARLINEEEVRSFFRENINELNEYTVICGYDEEATESYIEQDTAWANGHGELVSSALLEALSWFTFFGGDTPLARAAKHSERETSTDCADAPFVALIPQRFREEGRCSVKHFHYMEQVSLIASAEAEDGSGSSYSMRVGGFFDGR